MRSRCPISCVLFTSASLAVLTVGPTGAAAKEKSQPAPQWVLDAAKTPTPDSAQDAAAVILRDDYLITVDETNRAVERERYAVRILKPQGRSYSHCEASYDVDAKLRAFHSWTIAADGKQFQALDPDFTDQGAYEDAVLQFSERIRTVNPPGSDPGAVVACETEVELRPYMSEEEWEIQQPIPVVAESLELQLPAGGHYAAAWRKYPAVKPLEVGSNHLRWEIQNMPALDLENLHAVPHWGALAARMSVKWGDLAVKGTADQWRAIGEWTDQLEEHRADPTPEITAKAQELVAGAPDLYSKLARITSYIQKNVRYFVVVKGIGGWQAHYAGDIFRSQYGDCKDKTTLLIAMLRAVGMNAYYLHVDTRRGIIDPEEPSLIGNHMITAIALPAGEDDARLLARVKTENGKALLIFDPTDEVTPVGLIRGQLQGAYGNLVDGASSQVLRMPVLPPDAEGIRRSGSFTLTTEGTLSGNLQEQFRGDDAARQRWALKETDARELREGLEKSLGADLPGLAFQDFHFSGASDLDKSLELTLGLSASGYAHAAGALLLLRPHLLGSHSPAVPDEKEREAHAYPIVLGHPGDWRDSYDITLPQGYVVDELPDPVHIDLDFASYRSSVSAQGSTLHYENEYVVRAVEIPAAEAQALRTLKGAILRDERGTVVLKKAGIRE